MLYLEEIIKELSLSSPELWSFQLLIIRNLEN